jgi:hypothetical protein
LNEKFQTGENAFGPRSRSEEVEMDGCVKQQSKKVMRREVGRKNKQRNRAFASDRFVQSYSSNDQRTPVAALCDKLVIAQLALQRGSSSEGKRKGRQKKRRPET